jgi:hypothetical protein
MMQVHLNGRRAPNEVDRTAKFIVKAANHHEGLKEALKLGLQVVETMWPLSGPTEEPESSSLKFINAARAILSRAN